ncbi:hypothetical protein ACLQ2S_12040 [Micromonospora sp. DT48]|nr:hypothetical protein [Micromonospora sp. CP22]
MPIRQSLECRRSKDYSVVGPLLLTKGEREEQQRKLDACGLLRHF